MLAMPTTHAQRKKQIAVLNFDFATVDTGLARHGYGDQRNLSRQISEGLGIQLTNLGSYVVVERERVMKIIGEQDFGSSGRVDQSTAAQRAKILGVDNLVVGTVTMFDLRGMPEQQNDPNWDPKNASVHISVNYSLIDTTTAQVLHASSATGSSQQVKAESKPKKSGWATGMEIANGILAPNNSRNKPVKRMTEEQLRDKVKIAVDEVVSRISTDLNNLASGKLSAASANANPETVHSALIIQVNGPSVVIRGFDRSKIRQGDRLYVRRVSEQIDPISNDKIRFTTKIGEVEIVEIQDNVVIGSYSGSTTAMIRDIVTNSADGKGIPESILNLSSRGGGAQHPTNANPSPARTNAAPSPTPKATPTPVGTGNRRRP